MATTYYLAAKHAGAGVAGLSPEFSSFRYGDGTEAPAAPSIVEVVGAAGWYRFEFAPEADIVCTVDLDPEQSLPLEGEERFLFFVLTADDSAISETRMKILQAGATRANVKLLSPVFNDSGKMESATLVVYGSAADLENDENRLLEVDVTATYDEAGNLSEFVGLEV